jgi:hypothetical protein
VPGNGNSRRSMLDGPGIIYHIDQAQNVVDDIESHLIYTHKPEFNSHHKKKPKAPWKQFDIKQFTLK